MVRLVVTPPGLVAVGEEHGVVVDGASGDVDEEGESGVDLFFENSVSKGVSIDEAF